MKSKRHSISKTVVALVGVVLFTGLATRASAIVIVGGSFGFVGMTAGQTLRLAVAHVGNPNENRATEPCPVEWTFFDATGAVVGGGEARLAPGTGLLDDLKAVELGGPDTRPGDRFEIRAQIKAAGSDANAKFCQNNLFPTLQVFDDETGRTMVVVDPSNPN